MHHGILRTLALLLGMGTIVYGIRRQRQLQGHTLESFQDPPPPGQCSIESDNKCVMQKSAKYPPISFDPVIDNRPYPPMVGLVYKDM